jgi:hypothetical protein
MWHTQVGEEIREQFVFEQVSWPCSWKNNNGLMVIECEDVDRNQLAQNGDQEYDFVYRYLNWHPEMRTTVWGFANVWSWRKWSNIDDGEYNVMWRFVLFIVYWIILRWMSEGRSDVQYMLRTGCSWRILWAAVCCCNRCG